MWDVSCMCLWSLLRAAGLLRLCVARPLRLPVSLLAGLVTLSTRALLLSRRRFYSSVSYLILSPVEELFSLSPSPGGAGRGGRAYIALPLKLAWALTV